jgi:hypothetical protein
VIGRAGGSPTLRQPCAADSSRNERRSGTAMPTAWTCGLHSHSGSGGGTYRQLYADAQRADIKGRSAMSKAELERHLRR